MRDNLPEILRTAAKEWREETKFVGVGETRYDVALEEAANSIEELEKLTDAQLEPCDFRCEIPGGQPRCTFPKKGAEPTGFPPCRFDACRFSHPVRLPQPPPRPWLSEAYEMSIKRFEPMSLEEIQRDLLQDDSVQRAIADATDAVRYLVEVVLKAMPEFRIDTNENGEPSVTAVWKGKEALSDAEADP